jgi:hypothetical protein
MLMLLGKTGTLLETSVSSFKLPKNNPAIRKGRYIIFYCHGMFSHPTTDIVAWCSVVPFFLRHPIGLSWSQSPDSLATSDLFLGQLAF